VFRTARLQRSTPSARPRRSADRSGGSGAPTVRLRRGLAGAVAALTIGASVLTGCAAGQISQTADQIANVDGAQGTVGPIGVRQALLATPEGANYAKGSQAPLTLWISNDSQDPDTLTGISTDAGTVKITGTATVGPRSLLQIGGDDAAVTAMLTGLTRELNYGISVPMTFSFAKAGQLSLNVPIEIPAQRTDTPRPTVNIYPEEPPNLWETGESTATNLTSPNASGNPTPTPQSSHGPTSTPGPTTGRFNTETTATVSTANLGTG
jgi:copper(I)-binding protein